MLTRRWGKNGGVCGGYGELVVGIVDWLWEEEDGDGRRVEEGDGQVWLPGWGCQSWGPVAAQGDSVGWLWRKRRGEMDLGGERRYGERLN